MKKIISLLLAIISVFSLTTNAFAENISEDKSTVSITEDYNELLKQFTVKKSSCGMKYAYYSPVKDKNDTTKYPLIVYVHGRFHGWTDKTFLKSGLTYWCSQEIQEQFENDGAHLLMPKLSEFMLSSAQSDSVYKVIREYINENIEHVDESKVLIMGGSAGGGVVWKLLISHPKSFSAGVSLCATKIPSTEELKTISDIPVWIISSKTDPLINYTSNQSVTWKRLCNTTNVGEKCRWSVFDDKVTLPDGSHPIISHFLAKTIGYNLCKISDKSPLPDKTINGLEENVQLNFENSIINWFEAS